MNQGNMNMNVQVSGNMDMNMMAGNGMNQPLITNQ